MVAELLIDRNDKQRLVEIKCDSHSTMAIILGRLLQYDDTSSLLVKMNEVERKLDETQEDKLTKTKEE